MFYRNKEGKLFGGSQEHALGDPQVRTPRYSGFDLEAGEAVEASGDDGAIIIDVKEFIGAGEVGDDGGPSGIDGIFGFEVPDVVQGQSGGDPDGGGVHGFYPDDVYSGLEIDVQEV